MIPKFRAWDKILKKMNDVTAIDFSTKPFRVFYSAYGEDNYFNQDAILMQSTGMSDINGVEIFEGDIVSTIHGLCEVRYIKDGYYIVKDNKISLLSLQNVRVVGNIYENPDWIEE